ncbi:Hypothetical predicted protein, partial [Marmota monax]
VKEPVCPSQEKRFLPKKKKKERKKSKLKKQESLLVRRTQGETENKETLQNRSHVYRGGGTLEEPERQKMF